MASSTKITLQLLSLPTLLGAALGMMTIAPAHANTDIRFPSVAPSSSSLSCDVVFDKAQFQQAASKSAPTDSIIDFSAAESDAAVILFGCDCPSCIGALRQLRQQALLGAAQGHCWTALSNGNSQQMIGEVLDAVELTEAQGADVPLMWTRP